MSPRTKEQFTEMRNDRHQAILDAALHVFAEDTYHGASVSKIAKRAGVSKGLMYNYFESKEELLKTLVFEIADRYMERLALPKSGEFKDADFVHMVDLSFNMILEDLPLAKLFFSVYTQSDVMAIVTNKMMERVIPYMNAMTHYFQQKGHEDPQTMMRYFSATIDGIQMHVMMDEHFPLDDVKKLIIKQFAG